VDQNLADASLPSTTLTGVDLTRAIVHGASLDDTIARGFTSEQLYATVLTSDELAILIVIPQRGPFGTNRAPAGRQYPKREPLIAEPARSEMSRREETSWCCTIRAGAPESIS
jgi:uncharacterized protein YjbI with pentapeptide repeats